MSYFAASLDQIRGPNAWPEFQSVLASVEAAAFARARAVWPGWQPGGIFPGPRKFGVGPLRKNDMAGDTTDSTPSGSYNFNVPSAAAGAWRDVFRYTVRDDTIHAIAGFAFTDDVLRFSQLRFEVESRLYPIQDIQFAQNLTKFNLVLKLDAGSELIAEPKQRVLIRGFQLNTGVQRVVPIGLHLYRNLNAVLTEV